MKIIKWALPTVLAFTLTACMGGKTPDLPNNQEQPSGKQEQQQTQNPPEVEKTFKYTAPLTGMGTDEELPKRTIMVMVNNAPQARPQSGLDQADLVYEILAEGWITRFVAIYHSEKPEVIGPVRSIRSYYVDLGGRLDAIMVHAGGSPAALSTLEGKGMAHLDEIYNGGGYFWRESFRKPPHNLYTDLTKIWDGAKALGFREEGEIPKLDFAAEDADVSGDAGNIVKIRYSEGYNASYEYDAAAKNYKRLTNGEPHLDLTTKKQLTAVNVMIIEAPHRIIDNEGRRDINLFGPGEGMLLQRGKVQPIKWEMKDGIIRAYSKDDGAEVKWFPGNTWINVIPDKPGLQEAVVVE
ncbi:DUF3048 domain-containing protein [Ammoniphilus resinae]|uniref:DUF3048 domain-containing protein n=1 Tax=Ammoniphilus resinae TaxID=861532 RepID=A0ABS4GIJ6_9BACL|nr:DUF3048 domain-containing protein [Ammoniphilus resinae]MBP1930081.1 hypothetical protein [Ammoniphilus resinae]